MEKEKATTSSKKRQSRVVLQHRDLEILRCCYEQQFLTHKQVERYFYNGRHSQNARNRIGQLKKAGFLRSDLRGLQGNYHVLRVTEAGRNVAASKSTFDVPQSKGIDLATLDHDLMVTDVRLRLHELWDGIWTPEKALKDKYPLIPDGLFQFETGTTIGIEIENSLKGRARFEDNLREWQRVEGILMVLFVATSQYLFSSIAAYMKDVPAPTTAFGVIELDKLMSATPSVHSPRGEYDLFKSRSL